MTENPYEYRHAEEELPREVPQPKYIPGPSMELLYLLAFGPTVFQSAVLLYCEATLGGEFKPSFWRFLFGIGWRQLMISTSLSTAIAGVVLILNMRIWWLAVRAARAK